MVPTVYYSHCITV